MPCLPLFPRRKSRKELFDHFGSIIQSLYAAWDKGGVYFKIIIRTCSITHVELFQRFVHNKPPRLLFLYLTLAMRCVLENSIEGCFPQVGILRAEQNFSLSFSALDFANKEKIRLVENNLSQFQKETKLVILMSTTRIFSPPSLKHLLRSVIKR